MNIGHILLDNKPIFLAPMEDVSDLPFRKICKTYGVNLTYTEFVSSDGLLKNITSIKNKMYFSEDERPIGIQLYGNNIESMVHAAKIAEEANPDLIDLNFGCPVRKIANKGGGAGMLRDIPKLLQMTKEIVDSVKLPVTVKTRLGWDENSKIIIELAERLQDLGIKAITIHGRTREQMYSGEADWSLIGEVKNNQRMKIPVIGNGDIDSPEKALQMFNRYGVDALMIGRASIGNPYLFKQIRHYLDTGEKLPDLTLKQRIDNLKILINNSIEWSGEVSGILHMRRHMAKNFMELSDFRPLRIKMLRAANKNELWNSLDEIELKYQNNYNPGT